MRRLPVLTDSLGRWASRELGAGSRWAWVATESGRFTYLCDHHPSMKGTISVVTAGIPD